MSKKQTEFDKISNELIIESASIQDVLKSPMTIPFYIVLGSLAITLGVAFLK